jgi:hypothetical protein
MRATDVAPGAISRHPQMAAAEGFVSALAAQMRRLGSWRVWTVSAVIFVVFAGAFFSSSASFAVPEVEATCGQAPLDVRFHSTADDVGQFLTDCGPAGRDAYRSMQLADLAYPLVFGLFMASSLAIAFGRVAPGRSALVGMAVVPLVGSGFDYLENLFAWRALAAFPDAASTNAVLGLASTAKTVTFWVAGTLLLVCLAVLAGRVLKRRGRVVTAG